jgi:hypothetical protein
LATPFTFTVEDAPAVAHGAPLEIVAAFDTETKFVAAANDPAISTKTDFFNISYPFF